MYGVYIELLLAIPIPIVNSVVVTNLTHSNPKNVQGEKLRNGGRGKLFST